MEAQRLKLVDPAEVDNPYVFDRRRAHRRRARGEITAVVGGTRICPLQLRDVSETGFGAMALGPIEVGVGISFYVPENVVEGGWQVSGRVTRCLEREGGCEIGVSAEPKAIHAA